MITKRIWRIFLITLIIALPVRLYQTLFLLEPETGFYSDGFVSTGIVFIALMAGCVLLYADAARGKAPVPVLPLPLDASEMRGALALRNQLPKPDLASWVPADKELRSFRRAQRARARTVGEIFEGLMRLDERASEVIPGLVVDTLVRADRQHKALCAKDVLKLMPSITDEQAADVLRACEENETLAGLANMGVVEELRELVEQKRAL